MLRPQTEPDEQAFRFGSFTLDVPGRALLRGSDTVPLTPKELDVLVVLVRLRGTLVSKDDLIARAWGGEPIADSALFQTVYRLRRTLAQYEPYAEYIATVPGRGYQFVGRVQNVEPAARSLDVSSEAFKYYSRAMFEFQQRSPRSVPASIALFRHALRLDPRFAPAYAGLAHAHVCAGVALLADNAYCYHRAMRACRAALALDPNYGDAYAILSEVHVFFDGDVERAQAAVERALALSPNSPRVQTAAFWAFLSRSDIQRAAGFARDALLMDPTSNHFIALLGIALYYAGRLPEAHAQLMHAHLFRPADSMALFYDACALCLMGDHDGALQRLAQMNPLELGPRALALRAWIACKREDRGTAMQIVRQISCAARIDEVSLALAFMAVNEVESARRHVRKARESKQTGAYLIALDPLFEPLGSL